MDKILLNRLLLRVVRRYDIEELKRHVIVDARNKNIKCSEHLHFNKYKYKDIMKYLLEQGADINTKDLDGHSLLLLEVGKTKSEDDIIKLLVESGCPVESNSFGDGTTAFMSACRFKSAELLKYLIKNGAYANTCNSHKETPLIFACMFQNIEAIKLLISEKVDINVKSNYDDTALICASKQGNLEIVELLVNAGAELNISDKEGLTASMHARHNRHSEVVEYLTAVSTGLLKENK